MDAFGDDGWDIETDEEYAAILGQVRTTPPRCLKDVAATLVKDEEWRDRVRWSIACRCGGERGALLGYPLDELSGDPERAGLFACPIAFRCAACDRVAEVFDSAEHGYNAEFSRDATPAFVGGYRGEGPRQAIGCPGCGRTECRVVMEFLHAHFDHIEDEPELLDVAQDYFDALACELTCAACGHAWTPVSYELA